MQSVGLQLTHAFESIARESGPIAISVGKPQEIGVALPKPAVRYLMLVYKDRIALSWDY